MAKRKIALLIDVDNVKIGKEAVEELLDKLNANGEVVYCKFYGYNDRKHLYLSDVIMNYGYETAPFMRLKKRYSQLDNRMIVDAVRMNYTKPEIDTYCLVNGDGDLIPLLVELKSCGKTVIDCNTEYQEINTHMFDEHISLHSIDWEVETYTAKGRKKAAAKKAPAKKAEPKPAPVVEAKPEPKPAPVEVKPEPVVEAKPVVEEVKPAPAPVVEEEPVKNIYEPVKTDAERDAEIEELRRFLEGDEEEDDISSYVTEPNKSEEDLTKMLDDEEDVYYDFAKSTAKPAEEEYYDEPEEVNDLSEALKDITTRYHDLDFTSGDNLSEKLKLIKDIEMLIESENIKGEGIYSDNEDIRQIFSDLKDVVEDLKSSI